MTQTTFDQLVDIYKQITFSNGRRGSLDIDSAERLERLKSVLNDAQNTGIHLVKPVTTDELKVGSSVVIEASEPRVGLGLLADNYDDVLNFKGKKGRFEEPRKYYLLPDRWANGDANAPEIIVKYRVLLEFIGLLTETATYLDKDNLELVFVHPEKLVLELKHYNSSDISAINTDVINQIIKFFNVDIHREQKLKIFEKVLHSKLRGIASDKRFVNLLSGLNELLKELKDGYSLFAADFSYEKIANQLEVAKLEELGKINKTFSEIQNQVLGIPVATIIVATQLKNTSLVNDVFWINSAVLVGVWIFAILVILVIRNQSHTLDAISLEIKRKEKQIEADFAAIKPVVSETFELLNRRVCYQRIALYSVDAVVVLGLIMAHVIYFVLTIPAKDWFYVVFSCS